MYQFSFNDQGLSVVVRDKDLSDRFESALFRHYLATAAELGLNGKDGFVVPFIYVDLHTFSGFKSAGDALADLNAGAGKIVNRIPASAVFAAIPHCVAMVPVHFESLISYAKRDDIVSYTATIPLFDLYGNSLPFTTVARVEAPSIETVSGRDVENISVIVTSNPRPNIDRSTRVADLKSALGVSPFETH